MSEASDKLQRSRQAILEHVARRERHHDPREEPAGYAASSGGGYPGGGYPPGGSPAGGYSPGGYPAGGAYEDEEPMPEGGGWVAHMAHALRTWWRYHPAHMAVELADPLMRSYARRKPVQLLAISLAAGAALTFARPWRLISLTTLLVALLKSSQLSHLFMAALSAADYRKDNDRP